MAKTATSSPGTQGPANAAAAFADGHIDQVAPITPGVAREVDPLAAERERDKVGLLRDPLDPGEGQLGDYALSGYILVTCAKPGFRRAGMAHPIRAEYPLHSFTQEQIDALTQEPMITFVAINGEAIPRETALFGDRQSRDQPRDPVLAGMAAAAAISDPPNRANPGLRNAVASGNTR